MARHAWHGICGQTSPGLRMIAASRKRRLEGLSEEIAQEQDDLRTIFVSNLTAQIFLLIEQFGHGFVQTCELFRKANLKSVLAPSDAGRYPLWPNDPLRRSRSQVALRTDWIGIGRRVFRFLKFGFEVSRQVGPGQ